MKPLFSILLLLVLAACSSTRQTTLSSSSTNQAMAGNDDQVAYVKTTDKVNQQSEMADLLGTWYMHTMKRQEALPEETLNLYMNLNNDQSFVANTTCGQLKGQYALTGMSIRFSKVSYNRNECGNAVQLDEMVRLLTDVVSQYSFNGNMLFLKDNAGNTVFRVTR
ncbi:MAG TPA: META domain-containing protein [Flavisolibacter sp.]|jgi:heat shock protein HslJ|nr:META domain-containing protein [Flavisolibacter sp.]